MRLPPLPSDLICPCGVLGAATGLLVCLARELAPVWSIVAAVVITATAVLLVRIAYHLGHDGR